MDFCRRKNKNQEKVQTNNYLDRILLWSFSFSSFFLFFLSFLSFLPRILLSNSYFRSACRGVSESVSLDVELEQETKLYLCEQMSSKFVTGYWTLTKIKVSYILLQCCLSVIQESPLWICLPLRITFRLKIFSYIFLHIVSFSLINFVSKNLLHSKSVIFSVKKANLRIALSKNFPKQGMVLIMTWI